MHFPQLFVNQLIDSVNVVDFIHRYVPLKKSGNSYKGLCPFHSEKTPSFMVNEEKQTYKCFGCGEGGDILSFIMSYYHHSFPEAVEYLAELTNTPLPSHQQNRQQDDLSKGYYLLDKCMQHYQKQLASAPERSEIKQYLAGRQLDDSIIKTFQLGFAPHQWDFLLKQFATTATQKNPANSIKKNDSQEKLSPDQQLLKKFGMLSENDKGRVYDRFRNRFMFPIHNRRGKVVGFGGRVIAPDDQPKYLNSPESPIFKKRQELYGLYQSLKASHQPPYLLITEGYMDVIALHQGGIPRAVASMGTSLTVNQLEILYRHTDKLILCFDGDNAGLEAANRAAKTILPALREEWKINFLLLPADQDPDSLIHQEGTESFIERINTAMGVTEFINHRITFERDVKNLESRPQLIAEAKKWLRITPSNSWRDTLEQSIAKSLLIDVTYLKVRPKSKTWSNSPHPNAPDYAYQQSSQGYQNASSALSEYEQYERYGEVGQTGVAKLQKNAQDHVQENINTSMPNEKWEHKFIAYAIQFPKAVKQLNQQKQLDLSLFSPFLNQLINYLINQPEPPTVAIILANWRSIEDKYQLLEKLANRELIVQKVEEATAELAHLLNQLTRKHLEQQLHQIQSKISDIDFANASEVDKQLHQQYRQLRKQIKRLSA